MPWDALPQNLSRPHDWDGKDHDKVWYTRWVKYVKGWFAMSYRSRFAWARWRNTPRILFAYFGKGDARLESDRDGETTASNGLWYWRNDISKPELGSMYVSRVQYWCRWHLAVQWPLQVTFHIYWRAADVPVWPHRPADLGIKKLLFVYGPTHRDADKVYWIFSFYIGGQWK